MYSFSASLTCSQKANFHVNPILSKKFLMSAWLLSLVLCFCKETSRFLFVWDQGPYAQRPVVFRLFGIKILMDRDQLFSVCLGSRSLCTETICFLVFFSSPRSLHTKNSRFLFVWVHDHPFPLRSQTGSHKNLVTQNVL